jgi:hypothetical protein
MKAGEAGNLSGRPLSVRIRMGRVKGARIAAGSVRQIVISFHVTFDVTEDVSMSSVDPPRNEACIVHWSSLQKRHPKVRLGLEAVLAVC